MLILMRGVGQKIRIGDDVTVTIVELHGKQVRVGIEAPLATPVHREEIFLRIAAEKAGAK